MSRSLSDFLDALEGKSAAVVLGAGISYPRGIPTGYELPMLFAAARFDLVRRLGLEAAYEGGVGGDEGDRKAFTDLLTSAFASDEELQEAFLAWLKNYPAMDGEPCDDHATFVLLWLRGVIRHLVTTNWDFMLEKTVDDLYEIAYDDPMSPAEFTFLDGSSTLVEAERLFHAVQLDDDVFNWRPRYEIVASERDLPELDRGAKAIWKIHGSPFFLACSHCRGANRWHRSIDLSVGDPCPEHPSERLRPEITFWGRGVDQADPRVWRALKKRICRCEIVFAVGFSGKDTYLKKELLAHKNAWVIDPSPEEWRDSNVQCVAEKSTPLADALRRRFL